MPFADRVVFLADDASPDFIERLSAEGFVRLVVGGRPMERSVEPLAKTAIDRRFDVLLLTDLSASEPSPDGGVLRSVLRLRKAGASLTNCGQVTTILASHKARTALVLVNVDPADHAAFPHFETSADLEFLLAHSAKSSS